MTDHTANGDTRLILSAEEASDAAAVAAESREWATIPARRSLQAIGLYRVASGEILLGVALMLDLKAIHFVAPYGFLAGAVLYLIYGIVTFLWIRRGELPVPLPSLVFSLLAGDVLFVILLTVAIGGAGGPLQIL